MAPLPKWLDLCRSFFYCTLSDEALSSPWRRLGELALWHSRSAWSLVVIAMWRKQLFQKKTVYIWLPDYFCNESLLPLRNMGAQLIFYPINESMAPEMDACKFLLVQHPIDIFVLVHYFGKPTIAESVKSFCETHEAWLIEDATHVLKPINGVGDLGDCVLYSPHKHLPIPDGAVLILRPGGPSQLMKSTEAMKVLSEIRRELFLSSNSPSRLYCKWVLKRITQALGLQDWVLRKTHKSKEADNGQRFHNPQMGELSKRLLAPLLGQLKDIEEKRQELTKNWAIIFSWIDFGVKVTHASGLECPYMAVFTTEKERDISGVLEHLQKVGLPIITWPDLPPEVLDDQDSHSVAIAMRNKCFYLPVHQSLSLGQLLGFGGRLLSNAVKNWKIKNISQADWNNHWLACSQANLLQSWQYGDAKEQAEGWEPKRMLILNENDQPVALAQVLNRKIPFIGSLVRLNRGPLLLLTNSKYENIPLKLSALAALVKEVGRQRCFYFRVAPEFLSEHSAILGLKALGFRMQCSPKWASGRISLQIEEQALFMSLQGKWRNSLRKGEKLGVSTVQLDGNSDALTILIRDYAILQKNREFNGLSEKLIRALATQKGIGWRFNIFIANEKGVVGVGNPIGTLVTIQAGDTATYLIGISNSVGRQMQANSVLLWQAILHAKKSGCDWFDIGGLSSTSPKGVAEFKLGLNAKPYQLVGEWWKINFSVSALVKNSSARD